MAEVKHTERAHALLSASGATRWMSCTPSARLEEKFEESSTSSYAQEGTLAHEFADINLRWENNEITKGVYTSELKRLRTDKFYTDEMEEQVSKYVSIVMEMFTALKAEHPETELIVERRVDYSHLVEGGFGTGDACIVSKKMMVVADLKYGKGVRVDAENNPQLRLYGLGALRDFDLIHPIEKVRMVVIQPRLDHISEEEMLVSDLKAWGLNEVKPKAELAYKGLGSKKAGNHCKWCKVKAMCTTLADENLELAKHDFKKPDLLTDEQVVGIYKQLPMLVAWANSVSSYMLDQANKGKYYTGLKLVEGRSNRRWSSEEDVIKELDSLDIPKEDYTTQKLKGLGAIEKLVGREDFANKFSDLVIKPQGKPSLVPLDDKRPAMGIEQAKEDFK